MKNQAGFEWLLCCVILSIIFLLQIKIIDAMFVLFLSEYHSIENIMKVIGNSTVIISIIASWTFITVSLHSIAILVDINTDFNFAKLYRRIGIGFIFILIALIVNKHNLDIFFQSMTFEYDKTIYNFTLSRCYELCKMINYASYFFLFLWSFFTIKKAYRMTYLDSLLVCSITSILFLGMHFFQHLII